MMVRITSNPHSLSELKENTQQLISFIPRQLQCVSRNIFSQDVRQKQKVGACFETLVGHTAEGK
jgi:hypothetical protein